MAVLLFLLWLLLAGQVTPEVCLWGMAASLLLTLFCGKVLGYRHLWSGKSPRKLAQAVRYLAYLLAEMLKAGFVVMKLIYTRGRDMEPKLVWFDTDLESERAQAALADSITLTAGTITVTAEDGRFCVHALDESLARGIEDTEFQRRLKRMEA